MGNLDKESFKIFKISEIGTIISGATPKTSDDSNFGGAIPWLTPADLSGYKDKYISCGARNITQKGYDSCSTQLMPAGSVLLSSRAPIGYVAIAKNPICTNQGFKSIVPKTNVDSEYLYYHLLYLKKTLQDMGSGTTFKELSAKKLGQVEVSLPSLNEQKRIVARIEELFSELDAAVATLERTKEQLAVYRQAVLKEAFESDSPLYFGNLGDYLVSIDSGKSFKCIERPPGFGEYGVIKVSAVTWGEFNESESKTCPAERFIKEKEIHPGDFLFSRANTLQLIGNSVIVKDIQKKLMLSDKILRLNFSDNIFPRYVLYFLRSKCGKKQIQEFSTGNQESMRNIGQDRIRRIVIPYFELETQKKIVSEIESRLSVCHKIEEKVNTALQEAEAMRQSILKQAFAGEL